MENEGNDDRRCGLVFKALFPLLTSYFQILEDGWLAGAGESSLESRVVTLDL